MWKLTDLSGEIVAFSVNQNGGKTVVLMYKSEKLWTEELTDQLFNDRCHSLNPNMEFTENSTEFLIGMVIDNFKNDSFRVIKIDAERPDTCVVHVETRCTGVPFIFEFYFRLCDTSTLYSEIMKPLFSYTHELERKVNLLTEMIKKKELELNHYIINFGNLPAKAHASLNFDEAEFQQSVGNLPSDLDCLESFVKATEVAQAMVIKDSALANAQEVATSNEAPDPPTGVQDSPGLSSGVQDSPGLSSGVQDSPGLSSGVQDCPGLSPRVQDLRSPTNGTVNGSTDATDASTPLSEGSKELKLKRPAQMKKRIGGKKKLGNL